MDYLADLGVGSVWLSPVYKSPMKDNGYDVQDYKQIDPVFGTLEDFKVGVKNGSLVKTKNRFSFFGWLT